MNVTIFGATGSVGSECLRQCIDRGYAVTVLARSPDKLPQEMHDKATILKGDGLVYEDVASALNENTDAVLFAVGVDEKTSPENLCTNVTRNILTAMREKGVKRLVWCGGGSNLLPEVIHIHCARKIHSDRCAYHCDCLKCVINLFTPLCPLTHRRPERVIEQRRPKRRSCQ